MQSKAKKDGKKGVSASSRTYAEIVKDNVLTYYNLIFAVLAALLILAGSFKSLTFLPVVIANMAIGMIQEIRAKKALEKLAVLSEPAAKLVKGGQIVESPVDELVPGDAVVFRTGDQICADACIKDGTVFVNEALLTGESIEIKKDAGDTLLSGSFVVSGECTALLDKVGEDSFASRLTEEARTLNRKERSEMIRVLNRLVGAVGIIIIPVGVIMLVQQHWIAGEPLADSIVSMVAAVIGMIPEGLYFLTSVALAVSTVRLSEKRLLLHDMKCIETLARVDVLCVDKTGTITDANMKVAELVPLADSPAELEELISDFMQAMPQGNITDKAIRQRFSVPSGRSADLVEPFSSAVKYAAATFAGVRYLMGAPEFVMQKYAFWSGEEEVERCSSQGYRVVLFAAEYSNGTEPLGLILLENPVRENAAQTFEYFTQQGVEIKVISGDDPRTVSRVALTADIPGAENYVDATELTSDSQLAAAAEKYTVFGRVTPQQKRVLIKALKDAGRTVGMTGDGVNDVLALKDADCSVAMASGCDAAVRVSQLVLLDSDFSAMPSAVAEGRRVVNNIQRSASLFLVKNIFSFVAALLSILFAAKYPLVPSQVSLISAFTIGIPGFFMALAPNRDRIEGNFMENILLKAIPAGLTGAIVTTVFSQIGLSFGMEQRDVSTACTVLFAFICFFILVYISRPLNVQRIVLFTACLAGYIAVCVSFHELFELTPLIFRDVVFVLVFVAASLPLLYWFTWISEKLLAKRKTAGANSPGRTG